VTAPEKAEKADEALRRASRLLRWYPRTWRSRYGEEFAELLIADISERPRSRTRTADVARGGIVARLAAAGLCGCTLEASAQVRAGLTALAWCVAVFVSLGAAMWSQLTIGWQWSEPDNAATTVAMVLMSAAMLAFLVLALAAAAPVLWCAGSRIARGRGRSLLGPGTLVVACAVIMFVGGRHFGNGWPGTGGHPWARQGLVPGGVAAFSWASTMSVSSYWVHPSALAGFPPAELAWMVLSPLAVVGLVGGAAALVRRTELSARVLDFETWLGTVACAAMAVFLGGCCAWIVDGGPGPGNLFRSGAIDAAGAVVLTIAVVAARHAVRTARLGVARI
jgi:hypothetical protein